MKRPTFLGSALSVLLLFSVISYSQSFIQPQDPKAVRQPTQSASKQEVSQPGADLAREEAKLSTSPLTAGTAGAPARSYANGKGPMAVMSISDPPAVERFAVAPQTYTATAYSLRGRTASGRFVSRGLIAADPAVLPLGTRVRVEAGSLSGEYLVADTGGAVRGRHIDIWTPTAREAMLFGRRAIKLTVLSFGIKAKKSGSARASSERAAGKSI